MLMWFLRALKFLKLKSSMKKVFYTMLTAVVFSACQNENAVNPRPTEEIISTVKISGRVKAELNTTNAVLENVPDGTKIVAEISTRDFVLSPSGSTYPNKYYEGTVTNGEYSIDVQAGPYGSDVTLYFPDFRADVTTAGTPVSTVFNGFTRLVSVVKGRNEILDANY
jgi:hypothetical protein